MTTPLCLRTAAAALGIATASGMAMAETLHVPDEYPTIQAAIAAAEMNDEVLVAPGVYPESIDLLGKAIAVRSSGGAEVTTIDATGLGGPVVQCTSGETNATILEGFRITGGNVDGARAGTTLGGGLFNENSSPTVIGCLFEGNQASHGGGIFNQNSAATVIDCIFRGQHCDFAGGIYNYQSDSTITGCTFIDNTTDEKGGGVRNYDSSPTITDCRFEHNTTSIEGGAIANNDLSVPMISGCMFCENAPDDIAGAWIDGGGNEFAAECCPADIVPDGNVNVIDLLAVLEWWGDCPPGGPCLADLNGDLVVNVLDLLALLDAWGPCS